MAEEIREERILRVTFKDTGEVLHFGSIKALYLHSGTERVGRTYSYVKNSLRRNGNSFDTGTCKLEYVPLYKAVKGRAIV